MRTSFLALARRASVSRICRDDRGLSTVEYAIILVLVAVIAIGAWTRFGSTVKDKIEQSNDAVEAIEVDPDL